MQRALDIAEASDDRVAEHRVPRRGWRPVVATAIAAVGFTATASSAAVNVPAIFGSGMVVQRDAAIPVWGMAKPGERVEVSFAGQAHRAVADDRGRWSVSFAPVAANRTPQSMRIAGETTLELTDVLVGDVWLCAGQSNMQMGLARSADGEAAVAAADHPAIRLFNVANRIPESADGDVTGTWAACSPQAVPRFSAVGYYFGRALHERLDVPVGLINASWGATTGESWAPREVLQGSPVLSTVLQMSPERKATLAQMRAAYEEKLAQWKAESQAAESAGRTPTTMPVEPAALRPQNQPTACFDALVRPLIPVSLKGVVWYQGESNLGDPDRYRVLLPALIQGWRKRFGRDDLPFGIVQLPNNRPVQDTPSDGGWPRVREAQLAAHRSLPHTGLAVTIDVGEADDGHPKNKRDVGLRLAAWAMADVYGLEGATGGGPVFDRAAVDGGRMVLSFTRADGGLRIRQGGERLREFAVAGADRVWHWADAAILDDTRIAVRSDAVPSPIAVRYAWAENPREPNLTNGSGLPSTPFRSDDWPLAKPTSPTN